MTSRLTASCLLLFATSTLAGAQGTPQPLTELYRFVTIQAGPGKLPDLIALYRQRLPVMQASGDELPILIRHSQGDRWDLLVIYPTGSFTEYYSKERIAKREAAANASGVSSAAFQKQLYDLIAWHEDTFLWGPPIADLRAAVKDMGLAHLEMQQAYAGKHDELIKQRFMESAFNVARGRPPMIVFVHEQGGPWDVMTLDAWRDWRQYGEAQMVAPEVSEAAAKKAGFANADAVGTYLRQLMSTHHDSLGPFVNLKP